jgi:hypothetical protein
MGEGSALSGARDKNAVADEADNAKTLNSSIFRVLFA